MIAGQFQCFVFFFPKKLYIDLLQIRLSCLRIESIFKKLPSAADDATHIGIMVNQESLVLIQFPDFVLN